MNLFGVCGLPWFFPFQVSTIISCLVVCTLSVNLVLFWLLSSRICACEPVVAGLIYIVQRRSTYSWSVMNTRTSAFWQGKVQRTCLFVCFLAESLRVTQQHRASLLRKELNVGISNSKNSKGSCKRQYHLLPIICASNKVEEQCSFYFKATNNLDESLAIKCFALFFPF